LHPARETSSPRAGDKKRVWNVRADGKRQRYPTPGVKIARRHRVTSLMESCLSRQGQLVCGDRGRAGAGGASPPCIGAGRPAPDERRMEMSHVVDLTGMDFGYLHVIGRDTSRKGDTAHWIAV
jgi:hypothetical protein